MRYFFRKFAGKLAASALALGILLLNYSAPMRALRDLPGAIYAEDERELFSSLGIGAGELFSVSAGSSLDERLGKGSVSLCLPGGIPVKSVPVFIGARPYLSPGGEAVGISMTTEGVLIVGFDSVTDRTGSRVSPCERAGLMPGDVILSADGKAVSSSDELKAAVGSSTGDVVLLIERGGKRSYFTVKPETNAEGRRIIGAWVRDSTLGVGTLSFYDGDSGCLAALGHPVADPDTGSLLKAADGKLVLAEIIGVTRGVQGAPGELHGTFGKDSPLVGTVEANTELGLFGRLTDGGRGLLTAEKLPTAFPNEVHTGEAQIIASSSGEPRSYSCRIIKTGRQDEPAPKGIVVLITDERLIGLTGGIVQGMSGSPIIQDGRLAGVLTHVFVNDPRKGYGAYAYWMFREYEQELQR